ncbi:MAG: hypothetical protein GXY24_07285 [Bacteroidales bacterium]|nr:hypothetical protein [Bacteroidales bacterium]
MNLPSLIVLLLVAACLVLAIRTWRRAARSGGCSCGSAGRDPSACTGCSSASGCPYCKGK